MMEGYGKIESSVGSGSLGLGRMRDVEVELKEQS
jgi:hypothetical protein